MIHEPDVIRNLTKCVQAHPLPFHEVDDPTRLEQIAWGIAKIRGSESLWKHVYQPLGHALSQKVPALGERNLATIAWAFAKAGSRDQEHDPDAEILQHPALFCAIANRIADQQRVPFTSAQSVSNIIWSFAKLRETDHATALVSSMEEQGIRLMPSFKDQNVANTLWAMSRLEVMRAPLLRALLAKAGDTLYHDNYVRHVTMSQHVKKLHWFQVYTGYVFCKNHCPTVLDSASDRLVQDLERIHNRERFEGLSEGSGLETLAALEELDSMINAAEEAEDVDRHQFGVPGDSLEGGAAGQNNIVENDSNAQRVLDMVLQRGSVPATIELIILKFARSPNAFRRALMEGPELRDCRDALEGRVLLDSGAKVFVRPEHYEAVMEEIRRSGPPQLFSSHVIVEQDFEHLVRQALLSVPSSERVVGRGRMALPAVNGAEWDEVSQTTGVRIERTFITVGVAGSLLSQPLRREARSL